MSKLHIRRIRIALESQFDGLIDLDPVHRSPEAQRAMFMTQALAAYVLSKAYDVDPVWRLNLRYLADDFSENQGSSFAWQQARARQATPSSGNHCGNPVASIRSHRPELVGRRTRREQRRWTSAGSGGRFLPTRSRTDAEREASSVQR